MGSEQLSEIRWGVTFEEEVPGREPVLAPHSVHLGIGRQSPKDPQVTAEGAQQLTPQLVM